MVYYLVTLLGAVLGMALFGALVAWIIRKIAHLELKRSYMIGLLIMVVVAPILYTLGSERGDGSTFVEAVVLYALAGVIAYPVLVATSRKKTPLS